MDLYPTDDQTEIVDAAADYLARELPAERAPKQEGDRLTDAEWRGLADMGWFGLGLPEASGGLGLSVVEEALIVREFGRAIGGFQAISHRLAKAAARCEASVAMLQYAAVWLRDGFDHPELEVAAARLVAADAARENAAASMQVFGGYGQTYEFLPHFFLKRALILSALGGGAPADEAAVLEASTTL